MRDAFSKCHPAVNFLFFVGAIAFCALIQHPVYLAVGILCGSAYYLLLNGRKGIRLLLAMIPLFLFLSIINPLFNTRGDTVLFLLWGKPYTLEALIYGAVVAGIFVDMILWFGCYNKVLTSDKFTSLFGSLIPSISLLLVMVLRMVPNLMRQAAQISGARKSVGKGFGETAGNKEKLHSGAAVLGAVVSMGLLLRQPASRHTASTAARLKVQIFFILKPPVFFGSMLVFPVLTGFTQANFSERDYF